MGPIRTFGAVLLVGFVVLFAVRTEGATRRGATGVFHPAGEGALRPWADSDLLDLALFSWAGAVGKEDFDRARSLLQGSLTRTQRLNKLFHLDVAMRISVLGDKEGAYGKAVLRVADYVMAMAKTGRILASPGLLPRGDAFPPTGDRLSDEVLAHVRVLRHRWASLDRIHVPLNLTALRSRSPGWLARAMALLRDPAHFRGRNLAVLDVAADLPRGLLVIFVRPELDGRAAVGGGDHLSARGRLGPRKSHLGPEAMALWAHRKVRRYLGLVSVTAKAGTASFPVPVALDVRSAHGGSFLREGNRSPWKLLLESVSLRPEMSLQKQVRLGLGLQTMALWAEILPPWLRADLNASLVFGHLEEREADFQQVNLLLGTHFFLGARRFLRARDDLSSLLPAYFRIHGELSLEATRDWSQQDLLGQAHVSLFFPTTPLDLLGLSPGTPRAIHESYWSVTLGYGMARRLRGGGPWETRPVLGLEVSWVQPLPVEFGEIASLVIGNTASDSRKARARGRGGDELAFPIFRVRCQVRWEASWGSPLRFSWRRGFTSFVEFELKVPLGMGLYAVLAYADGRLPLSQEGTSEIRTGLELSM